MGYEETFEQLMETQINKCESCGTINDCRPLGENGKMICIFCAQEHPEIMAQQLNKLLPFGRSITEDMVRRSFEKTNANAPKRGVN